MPKYGVPLGVVGEISFWSPNRGLLITGGTEEEGGLVANGIYAYDGKSWHQLSIVCGGAEGRIVWAGPDEFWTIADQRSGQIVATSRVGEYARRAVSLCHFVGPEVVGSYAMPLEEADSWMHVNGGACYSPSDCWFGGSDARQPNQGAFHLHWNGSTVTAVYEPEDHSVTSMTEFGGQAYEAVQLKTTDIRLEGEALTPAVLHAVGPEGEFSNETLVSSATNKLLPEYGSEVKPQALHGFDLATNAPAGESPMQLWAAANPGSPPPGSKQASTTVLWDDDGIWSQLLPSPEAPLEGAALAGSLAEVGESAQWGTSGAIAPEPGTDAAWLSLREGKASSAAEVAQVEASKCESQAKGKVPCGRIVQRDVLPEAIEKVGKVGRAGPIACPAAHDCWMATTEEAASRSGWLFHLGDETAQQEEAKPGDGDPLFEGDDGVITSRPRDSGVPVFYASEFVNDDSHENQKVVKEVAPAPPEPVQQKAKKAKAKPLVKHVTSRMVHNRTLVITFTLTAKAHVRLVAHDHRAVVARTARETLSPGRHSLSLTLNPERWPTKLQFEAKPIGEHRSRAQGSPESESSGNTVAT